MAQIDLDSIERALGFPRPGFYRRFMVDYPCWLLELNRFARTQVPGWFFDDLASE